MVLGQAIVQDKQGYRHLIENTGQIRTVSHNAKSFFRSPAIPHAIYTCYTSPQNDSDDPHQSPPLFPKADGMQHLTLDWIFSTNHCTIIDILGKKFQSWLECTCIHSFQSCHTVTKWCWMMFGSSLWTRFWVDFTFKSQSNFDESYTELWRQRFFQASEWALMLASIWPQDSLWAATLMISSLPWNQNAKLGSEMAEWHILAVSNTAS